MKLAVVAIVAIGCPADVGAPVGGGGPHAGSLGRLGASPEAEYTVADVDDSVTVGTIEVVGTIEWEYVGPQMIPVSTLGGPNSEAVFADSLPCLEDVAHFKRFGSGREWRSVGASDAYSCTDGDDSWPGLPPADENVDRTWQNLDTFTCTGYAPKTGKPAYATDDVYYYSADQRDVTAPAAMTVRQKRVGSLHYRNYGQSWANAAPELSCTASVIGERAILTAAHCVSAIRSAQSWSTNDNLWDVLDDTQLRFCTLGNRTSGATCTDITQIFMHATWVDGGDHDSNPSTYPMVAENFAIAVLETATDLDPVVGSLQLENGPAGLLGVELHNNAYPPFGLEGSSGNPCEHPVSSPGVAAPT